MKRRSSLIYLAFGSIGALGLALVALPVTGTVKLYDTPTDGMSPTIQRGDRILATRIFRPAKTVRKGDIVVFTPPPKASSKGSKFVKRVAATGGDRIEVTDGELHVNGVPLPERGGKHSLPAKEDHPLFSRQVYPLTVPTGEVFLLGDNYENSLDSRYFGPVPIGSITHSADRIIDPAARAGELK